ncbi:MAG TPA: hypothetical protein VMT70_19145 [Vicinamibacteria bacterium]|nr:hypothetical protein [Vicinamibacteria bacterium]
MSSRPLALSFSLSPKAAASAALALLLAAAARAAAQATPPRLETDRIDITGRQNLTLGSGARAYGMGGAFLARADDATAASWNPAGLSYLRLPELSLVGAFNSFDVTRGLDSDRFKGNAIDFAAFAWPVGFGDLRGAVQFSYQRAISFDGSRHIQQYTASGQLQQFEDGSSDGGFDVVAIGSGLRLSRHVRAGFTLNRWLNGYTQTLSRTVLTDTQRPLRQFDLDFRPRGWNVNLGLIVSPVEQLNVAAVFKTPFTAGVRLDKSRRDSWGTIDTLTEVTTNAARSDDVRLQFPSSFGFGLSWRPRDTLTLSADYTHTGWSDAQILNYFELAATAPTGEGGVKAPPPPPTVYPQLQYPTLGAVPDPTNPDDPARLVSQQNSEQIRVGVEWVVIKGALKIPLRAGYFNDRQIIPNPGGSTPRFNGFTAGTGIILGSMLLDVAYIYEFGDYLVAGDTTGGADFDQPPVSLPPVRNTLTTHRVFASLIYRFSGHGQP